MEITLADQSSSNKPMQNIVSHTGQSRQESSYFGSNVPPLGPFASHKEIGDDAPWEAIDVSLPFPQSLTPLHFIRSMPLSFQLAFKPGHGPQRASIATETKHPPRTAPRCKQSETLSKLDTLQHANGLFAQSYDSASGTQLRLRDHWDPIDSLE